MSRAALGGRVAGGIPCLDVPDLAQACATYTGRLGFTSTQPLGDPPVAALARRGRTVVLLREVDPGARAAPRDPAAWDALIVVDDARRLAAELRARGARIRTGVGISHVAERTLEVRDGCGNVLAFAERPAGLHRPGRLAGELLPARARAAVRERRLAREERGPRRAFAEFYEGLADRADIFYMFFTAGLLHWVVHAERLVPDDVNLVLVGSDLPAEEQDWVRTHLRRPFHNIGLAVDDNTVWEFLFDVNRHDFGWLDIDCFVLEPALFAEMARIEPGVAVNGMWTYPMPGGQPVACTHFAFCNAGVIRRLRAAGRSMSPANYDWAGSNVSLLHPRTNCHVPTRRQREIMLEVLPPDERGRPAPPGRSPFFDTLVAYQVVATASGFPTRAVRPLAHRTELSLEGQGAGARVWQQDVSDEVVHVGGVSYYGRYFHDTQLRSMYLAAEHALLEAAGDELPASYDGRRVERAAELAEVGIDPAGATELVRRHLVTDRGLSPGVADRILGGQGARR